MYDVVFVVGEVSQLLVLGDLGGGCYDDEPDGRHRRRC